jgi:hypothetical protein
VDTEMEDTEMTEILNDSEGHPYWFIARRDEIEHALAEIPARTLTEAYKREWESRPWAGHRPPMTAAQLRRRVLAIHQATIPKGPLLVPIEKAAARYNVTGRTLRRWIADGKVTARETRQGVLAVEVPRGPRKWHLMPLRPDPRERKGGSNR